MGTLIYDLKKLLNDRYRAARVKALVDCDDKEIKIVDFRYYAKLEDAEVERINSESKPSEDLTGRHLKEKASCRNS